jgi:hypothetical protein
MTDRDRYRREAYAFFREFDFQNLGLCLQYTEILRRNQKFLFLADQPPGGDAGVPPRNVTPRQNKFGAQLRPEPILLQPGRTQNILAKTRRDVQPCYGQSLSKTGCPCIMQDSKGRVPSTRQIGLPLPFWTHHAPLPAWSFPYPFRHTYSPTRLAGRPHPHRLITHAKKCKKR